MPPVNDDDFILDASKHDVVDIELMMMERESNFEHLDFSNMHRKKDLDRIFPIKRGKLMPPKSWRKDAASIRKWRLMGVTTQSTLVQADRVKRSEEEAKRKRDRERERRRLAGRSAAPTDNPLPIPNNTDDSTENGTLEFAATSDVANSATMHASVASTTQNNSASAATITPTRNTPGVATDGENDEIISDPPVIVLLADCQELRDQVMGDRLDEYANSNKREVHKRRKPPNSIPQQNDKVVIKARNKMLLAAAKFAQVSTPEQDLAVGKYPKQQFCLVIINEVQDNNSNGAPGKACDPRPKPQMIVAANNHQAVYSVGRELYRGYPSELEHHSRFEHSRMFTPDEATGFIEQSLRTRNVGGVRTLDKCVGEFFNPPSFS